MSPARQRTVISRAYYAAYTATLSKCPVTFDKTKGMGTHEQLFAALRASDDPVLMRVAGVLKQLQGRRRLADYNMGDFITNNMVRDSIQLAEEILFEIFEMEEIGIESGGA